MTDASEAHNYALIHSNFAAVQSFTLVECIKVADVFGRLTGEELPPNRESFVDVLQTFKIDDHRHFSNLLTFILDGNSKANAQRIETYKKDFTLGNESYDA